MALDLKALLRQAETKLEIAKDERVVAAKKASGLNIGALLAKASQKEETAHVDAYINAQPKVETPPLPAGKHIVGISMLNLDGNFRHSVGMDGNLIELNDSQLQAVTWATEGKSFCLIGAAGSGKSTTQRAVGQALIQSGKVPAMTNCKHNWLPNGTPGVVIVSFQRRAVANIRKVLPNELKQNCITVHKLLEYQPTETMSEEVDKQGNPIMKQMFLPNRTRTNPLPSDIKTIIVEEAGQISVELWNTLMDAIPHKVQFIFLGDLYQLPPPMGTAILGYKLVELEVIELLQVYRNQSHILSFANDIKDGKRIQPEKKGNGPLATFPYLQAKKDETDGMITLIPFKQKIAAQSALNLVNAYFKDLISKGEFDPEEDIILCPFDREFSTTTHEALVSCIGINKEISQFLSVARGNPTWEINAGKFKQYLAVGDRILYDKQDAVVLDIYANPKYAGTHMRKPSLHLDRSGNNSSKDDEYEIKEHSDEDLIQFMSIQEFFGEEGESKNATSHIVKIRLADSEAEVLISQAGELNSVMFGYAITVYKSQGSEWRKVWGILHHSHSVQLYNETLYTMVTRAKEKFTCLCEPDIFWEYVTRRKIKGKTLREKAEYFKGKANRAQMGVPDFIKKALEGRDAAKAFKTTELVKEAGAAVAGVDNPRFDNILF